jgi:hypothetical protein
MPGYCHRVALRRTAIPQLLAANHYLKPGQTFRSGTIATGSNIKAVLTQIQTGHDFSNLKPNAPRSARRNVLEWSKVEMDA